MDTDLFGERLLGEMATKAEFSNGPTQRLRADYQVLVEILRHTHMLPLCRVLSTAQANAVMSEYVDGIAEPAAVPKPADCAQ